MQKKDAIINFSERRSEPRNIIDKYFSVEFKVNDLEFSYIYKIRDISTSGICLLVKEDSSLLKYINVGDVIKMKYYQENDITKSKTLNTKIMHITKNNSGRYSKHSMVGLLILEDEDQV